MRVAILSNVTTAILESVLKKEHEVWSPPGFGAWMETALNPPPELVNFRPEAIYILLDSHFTPIHGDFEMASRSLSGRFPEISVCVIKVADLAFDFGESFYDAKMWKLASMPWSLKGIRELRKLFSPIKKVVAIDLDNTLWDGVVGEDGVKGVRIKTEFLKELRSLENRGVLLTILSKNNEEDVAPILRSSALASVLKPEAFVAKKINWSPKPENLLKIAADLNLGVDSFVFVDDNPVERAQMRAAIPEVTVAAFPPNLELYFPRRVITAEDLDKTHQYQVEVARKEFAVGLSVDEYLEGLEIRTEIHLIAPDEVPRVAQLSQKTNQFNVCTNRYTEADVRAFVADPRRLLLTVHAGDRFGDQGLIAFVHVEIKEGCAEIVDWVMSCRAMNRRIEFLVEADLERRLAEAHVHTVYATWRRTLKNAPVRSLYEHFGFHLTSKTEDVKRYERILGEDRGNP